MKRLAGLRTLLCLGLISSFVTTTAAQAPIETVRVASGLNRPIYLTAAPGDFNRVFFLEKRGVMRVMDLSTGTINNYLDINSQVGGGTTEGSERGLLGLAFHPSFLSNGLFYVHYTNNSSDSVIAEWSALGDPATSNQADTTSESILMTIDQPQTNHNGGWLDFGPDGNLYIAIGDGGNFCDTGSGHTAGTGNAQDITDNLLGKILRVEVNPFGIPSDNPFVGVSGDDEIWAYGLRNPYRCSFDRLNGDLYIGDVGQDLEEEISFIAGTSSGGENFGWRCEEGNSCSTSSPSSCPATTGCNCPGATAGLLPPIHAYTHIPPPPPTSFVCSVTGGYVYRGDCIDGLQGHYFFADFCGGAIWSFEYDGANLTNFTNRTPDLTPSANGFTVNQIVSFGEDAAGEIYIVDQGSGTTTGQIFKIVPVGATFRNSAPNPASYTTNGGPVLGENFVGTVDLTTTGHNNALLVGYETPLSLTLGNGSVLLVNVADPNGEILGQTLTPGPSAVFTIAVPDDLSMCGFEASTQAVHIGGVVPFELSNAQDLIVRAP